MENNSQENYIDFENAEGNNTLVAVYLKYKIEEFKETSAMDFHFFILIV